MEIKVLSFNIWDLPLWFVRDRSKRLAGVIEYLKETEPDIVCLQESFDPRHRLELEKAFKGQYHITNGMTEHRKILYIKHFDTSGAWSSFQNFRF